MVTIWQTGKWVDAIQQTMRSQQHSGRYGQPQPFRGPTPPPPPPSSPNAYNYCPSCGRQLEFIQQYGRWYCRTCQKYV